MTTRQSSAQGDYLTGMLWMLASIGSFLAMTVASRELSADLSVFQILFFRSVAGCVVLALLIRRLLPELRRPRAFPLHLLRNGVHFAAQYCWTLGVVLLPLAEVFALEFTMPVWLAIFAALILGEKVTRARMIAIGLSFAGVLVILRPGVGVIDPAAFFVLAAAAGFGLAAVLVKLLVRQCSPAMVVVWMVLLQLPMGLAFAVFDWRPVSWGNLPWIAVAGLAGMGAHYAQAQALRILDASAAMPIDFLRVPLIALIGYLAYGEAVSFFLALGTAMILAANYYAMRAERRRRAALSSQP
ncbi:MAG: DMT family transporter [Paracoccus sp. (in: a-proteobacteria)]|nr:DMT family transporter [Paracoccus sp. (in: a-proteobacteria)]